MPEFVCPEELTRNEYLQLLQHNESYIFIKFGAEWCAPCNKIKDFVKEKCNELPDSVKCYDIDVDENFDVYAYMKSKKMVQSIPSMLIYKKGNIEFPPDFMLSDSDKGNVEAFFKNMTFK